MNLININRNNPYPLVDQIVDGIRRQVEDRLLRPGSKLPSIREFAAQHDVSRFTVVEAYDRLVATGYLRSKRGAGFFTTDIGNKVATPVPSSGSRRNEEVVWLIRRLLEAHDGTVMAGGPWLPDSWLDAANIRRIMKTLANNEGSHLIDYGEPLGYRPLRHHLAETMLPEIGINTQEDQILLTCGASQALDLVSRCLLNVGDAVLVDDPGYYNLFGNLRLQGLRLISVPRENDGPDVEALETLAAEHKPKLYFTQSVLQNPTGTTMSHHKAFRVLQAAGAHDFTVVEDDIFSDMYPEATPRLAALDQLERVIYLRSFSKTLSGSLRVGFIAANRRLIEDLSDTKMVTCVTTSLFTERLIYRLLTEGYYRKFLARLLERLGDARRNVIAAFERMGMETFCDDDRGMFVWARFPEIDDSLRLAETALKEGVMLARMDAVQCGDMRGF
jgi:DNA-binding transcriptional MocR family regulator